MEEDEEDLLERTEAVSGTCGWGGLVGMRTYKDERMFFVHQVVASRDYSSGEPAACEDRIDFNESIWEMLGEHSVEEGYGCSSCGR